MACFPRDAGILGKSPRQSPSRCRGFVRSAVLNSTCPSGLRPFSVGVECTNRIPTQQGLGRYLLQHNVYISKLNKETKLCILEYRILLALRETSVLSTSFRQPQGCFSSRWNSLPDNNMDDKDDVSRVESRQEDTQTNDYASRDIQKVAHRLDDTKFFLAQKRYLRKLDLTILPMISILYFFEYLDRGNIAVRFPYLSSPSDLQYRTLTSVH